MGPGLGIVGSWEFESGQSKYWFFARYSVFTLLFNKLCLWKSCVPPWAKNTVIFSSRAKITDIFTGGAKKKR